MSYIIKQSGIDALTNHIIDNFCLTDEQWKLTDLFGSTEEPTDLDICDFLEWNLNEVLDESIGTWITPFVEYGKERGWIIKDESIQDIVTFVNTEIDAIKRSKLFRVDRGENVTYSDICEYIDDIIYLVCRNSFNFDDIQKYTKW